MDQGNATSNSSTGNNEQLALQSIRPTLIVGVGGTGREVLVRIRRRFFETYGPLANYPSIGYLLMDTDQGSFKLQADSGIHAVYREELEFQEFEQVKLQVSSVSKYVDHLNDWRHIQRWFYPTLRVLGDIKDGAGQIRQYGRLAFFDNYGQVNTALAGAAARVKDQNNVRKTSKSGLRVDPAHPLDVFVVGSVAGGTGSGIFLDLAFLTKRLVPNAVRTGILVLPSAFGPRAEKDKRYANGYAALKELNHYKLLSDRDGSKADEPHSAHEFVAGWEGTEERFPGPPFDHCYLMEGQNERGVSSDTQGVFDLVADALFYEFAKSEFGRQKRSVRDNLSQYLVKTTKANPDLRFLPQPKRYSSLGVGTITFPASRLQSAGAAKLGLDLLAYWEKDTGSQNDPTVIQNFLEKEFLKQVNLWESPERKRNGPTDRQVLAALAQADRGGRTVLDLVREPIVAANREWRHNTPRNVFLHKKLTEADELCASWRQSEKATGLQKVATQLHYNLGSLGETLPRQLEEKVKELLAREGKSLSFVRDLLTKLEEILRRDMEACQRELLDEEKKADQARRQLTQALTELDQVGDRMGKYNLLRGMTQEYQVREVLRLMERHFTAVIAMAVRLHAIELYKALLHYLNPENRFGLRTRIKQVADSIDALRVEMTLRLKDLKESRHNSWQVMLYDEEEFDSIYRHVLENRTREKKLTAEQVLAELSLAVLNRFSCDLSTLSRALVRGVGTAADVVMEEGRPYFTGLFSLPEYDAVQRFRTRLSESEQAQEIRMLFNAAHAWVDWEKNFPGIAEERVVSPQRSILVAMPAKQTAEYQEFRRLISSHASLTQTQYTPVDSDNQSEVVVYSEVAGFPLLLLSSVHGSMRAAYRDVRGEYLHTDQNELQFREPVPLTDDDRVSLDEATRAFVLAMLLGELKVSVDREWGNQSVFTYPMVITRGREPRPEWLGPRGRAVQTLVSRPTVRESLLKVVTQRLKGLQARGIDAEARWKALLAYTADRVYPERMVVDRIGKESSVSLENEVLMEEMKKIDDRYEGNDEFDQLLETYVTALRSNQRPDWVRPLGASEKDPTLILAE